MSNQKSIKVPETLWTLIHDNKGEKTFCDYIEEAVKEKLKDESEPANVPEPIPESATDPVCPICGGAMWKGTKQWFCKQAHCKGLMPIA